MLGRRLSAFALLISCAATPLHARAGLGPDCWDRQEVEALKVQRFKTMLLVAALNCRERQPWIMADYNAFVSANRDLLAAKLSVVRQHFIRSYGAADGLNAYSSFETNLANSFSGASFDRGRCALMAREMRLASDVSERGLIDLAHGMGGGDNLSLCAPRPAYVSRTPVWTPPPPFRDDDAPAVRASEWPDLAPVEPEGPARRVEPNAARVAVAPPPPAAMSERAVEPVQVAEAAPAHSDKLQAVRDAAKALREALAALEASDGK